MRTKAGHAHIDSQPKSNELKKRKREEMKFETTQEEDGKINEWIANHACTEDPSGAPCDRIAYEFSQINGSMVLAVLCMCGAELYPLD